MDYSAPQSVWDGLAAAAPGKPIIGHICVTPEDVAMAIGKGGFGRNGVGGYEGLSVMKELS